MVMAFSNGRVFNIHNLDGRSYEGSFKHSKPNGKGKVILDNGRSRFGEWNEG